MADPKKTSYTYKDAGVDIDAGDALVRTIKPAAASTRRAGADAALGGFGALFDLKAAGFKDPLLVAGTDGVGTKLKIAIDSGHHGGVGIDLVAMCVNDLIVQGAEPLFFLDYYATGHLDVDVAAAVVEGIAEGCRQAGCALIGGETAEMPGMYGGGDYDLAGFAVGAVERTDLLTGADIRPGDVILGLASSGVHSNGYSLVRRIVADRHLAWSDPCPFDDRLSTAEALLTPTRIYVRSLLGALKTGMIKGLVHITGGGFVENIPRCLPEGTRALVDADRWSLPAVFDWLAREAPVSPQEMARTFNCGIGMIAICRPDDADALTRNLADAGELVTPIGTIAEADGGPACVVTGSPGTWGCDTAWTTAGGAA